MFKDYREPGSFTDEHRTWAKKLLKRRTHRLQNWDKTQYLRVLEDLYSRIRGNHQEAVLLARNVEDQELEALDTMVINCSAIAIVLGVLSDPSQSP